MLYIFNYIYGTVFQAPINKRFFISVTDFHKSIFINTEHCFLGDLPYKI